MTIARLVLRFSGDSSQLEASANRGAAALDKLGASVKRTAGTVASSREWTVYRNRAARELDKLQRDLAKAQKKMEAMRPQVFSRDSGAAEDFIRASLKAGWSDAQIESGLADMEKAAASTKAGQAFYSAQADVNKYSAGVRNATENLRHFTEQAEKAKAAEEAAKRNAEAAKRMAEAQKHIRHGLGRSLLMFAKVAIGAASLYRLLRKVARAFMESVTANEGLNKGLAQVKGNMAVAWQAIFNSMIPGLQALVNWLVKASLYVAMFFVLLSGGTWEDYVKGAKNQAKAIGGVGSAAKKAQKELAGFDAINKLAAKNAGGGGAGGIPVGFLDKNGIESIVGDIEEFEKRIKSSALYQAFEFWTDPDKTMGQKWKEIFQGLWEMLSDGLWTNISEGWAGKWEDFKNNFTTVMGYIKSKWVEKWEEFKNNFSTVKEYLKLKLEGIWENIKNTFKNVGTWFSEKFTQAKDGVIRAWEGVSGWFSDLWGNIKTTFSGIGTWFGTKFSEAWTGVTDAFSGVGEFFSGLWESITGTFTDIGTRVGSAVGTAFNNAINGILSAVDKTVNGLIRNINKVIGGINKIPGINIPTIAEVTIPRIGGTTNTDKITGGGGGTNRVRAYATGGIFDRATLGIIGERGREAVLPLENNTGWMDELAYKLAAIMGQSRPVAAGAGGYGDVNVYLGNEPIDARIERYTNRSQIRSNGRYRG